MPFAAAALAALTAVDPVAPIEGAAFMNASLSDSGILISMVSESVQNAVAPAKVASPVESSAPRFGSKNS